MNKKLLLPDHPKCSHSKILKAFDLQNVGLLQYHNSINCGICLGNHR